MNTERNPGYYRVRYLGNWRIAYTGNGMFFSIKSYSSAFEPEDFDEIIETPISPSPIDAMINAKDLLLIHCSRNRVHLTSNEIETIIGAMNEYANQFKGKQVTDESVKKIACAFFRHFWNSGGTNAEDAYDEWMRDQMNKKEETK